MSHDRMNFAAATKVDRAKFSEGKDERISSAAVSTSSAQKSSQGKKCRAKKSITHQNIYKQDMSASNRQQHRTLFSSHENIEKFNSNSSAKKEKDAKSLDLLHGQLVKPAQSSVVTLKTKATTQRGKSNASSSQVASQAVGGHRPIIPKTPKSFGKGKVLSDKKQSVATMASQFEDGTGAAFAQKRGSKQLTSFSVHSSLQFDSNPAQLRATPTPETGHFSYQSGTAKSVSTLGHKKISGPPAVPPGSAQQNSRLSQSSIPLSA